MSTTTLAAAPDTRDPSAAPPVRGVGRPGLALFVICTVQLLMVMDVTIVNISLPAIQADLGLSLQQAGWTVTAYAITFGGLLLAGGRIGDVLGRRRILVGGTLLFAAASMLAGSADQESVLVGARVLQGLGAALASPASLALIPAVFPRPEQRSRAMAVYAAMAGIGAVTGLVVGGTLTQGTSWRWVFFIGVPIAAFVVVLAPFVLPSPPPSRTKLSGSSAVLSTAGVASLVYAVTKAPTAGWGSAEVLSWLAVALVALATFAALEAHRSLPLLPRAHLRDVDKLVAWSVMFVVGGGMLGTLFFATHLLQADRGYGPLEAGVSFVPTNVSMIIGSQVAARLIARSGAWRLIASGALLSGLGATLLSIIDASDSYAAGLLPALVLSGLGFGLMFVSVVILAMKGAQPQEAGVISGLTSTMQQVGGAVSVAVLISIATSGHGSEASLDPRAGFVVLAVVMAATTLTALAMGVRGRRAAHGASPRLLPPQPLDTMPGDGDRRATARLDHTIVHVQDPEASAAFYADLLGLTRVDATTRFIEMADAHGVRLAFARHDGTPVPMHYAFRSDRSELDAVLARLEALGLDHWADPFTTERGRTYLEDGHVGAYWHDPDHHLLELIAPA